MVRWERNMAAAEAAYLENIAAGDPPEFARDVLPNSAKTELVVTANLRQWRHILRLRTDKRAHQQIRALMTGVRDDLVAWMPEVFQ
jgi:thymidylate synthase (FAD)